jgi:hypothetical protein
MKHLLIAFGLAATALTAGSPAHAQNYPWCEYLGGGMGGGGGRNCGFVSFEQCMESARGNGSDCRANTTYEPPTGIRQTTRKSRKSKNS